MVSISMFNSYLLPFLFFLAFIVASMLNSSWLAGLFLLVFMLTSIVAHLLGAGSCGKCNCGRFVDSINIFKSWRSVLPNWVGLQVKRCMRYYFPQKYICYNYSLESHRCNLLEFIICIILCMVAVGLFIILSCFFK